MGVIVAWRGRVIFRAHGEGPVVGGRRGLRWVLRPGRSAQRGGAALRVRAPAVLRGRSVVGAGDRLVRATFHGGAHAALVVKLGRLMAEADLVGGELVKHGGLLLVLGAVGQVVVGTAGAGALGGVGLGAAGPVGGGGAAAGAVAVPGAGHERRPARARVVDRRPHAGRVGLLGRGERVELGADLVDFGHSVLLRLIRRRVWRGSVRAGSVGVAGSYALRRSISSLSRSA